MRRVVFLSTHLPCSERRASFHWIAEALWEQGWQVDFATVGLSRLARLRRSVRPDARLTGFPSGRTRLRPRFHHLFLEHALHPVATGHEILDTLLQAAWAKTSRKWVPILAEPVSQADLVIVESGLPLTLIPLIREIAADVPITYRVNDDIQAMRLPDWLKAAELSLARHCTRISVASADLARRYSYPKVTCDPMGVPRCSLPHKDSISDPYGPRAPIEAVSAGTSHLDLDGLSGWADAHRSWRCHVLGRVRSHKGHMPPNLRFHGEVPYRRMLQMVAHADVGLAAYKDVPGMEYQRSHSNRIQIYRHYGLPILGPDRLCHPSMPSLIGYRDPDAAFRCETWIRRPEHVPDWSELAGALVQNVDTEPPFDVAMAPALA